MSIFTTTGKRFGLVLIAIVAVCIAMIPVSDSALADFVTQADTSPLDTPVEGDVDDSGENRTLQSGSSQNQSPLATPLVENSAENSPQQEGEGPPTEVPSPDLPTATESPTLVPTEAPTNTPTELPPLPPTEVPTLAPTETPVPLPTAEPATASEEEPEYAYPPEGDAVPQDSSPEEPAQLDTTPVDSALNSSENAASDPLDALFNIESMILALLCLIFISINALGVVALVVTMLYIRSRRNQPYP